MWGGAWVGGQIGAEAGAIGGQGGAFVGGIVGGMSAAMPMPDRSMPKNVNMNQGWFNTLPTDKLQIKQPLIIR